MERRKSKTHARILNKSNRHQILAHQRPLRLLGRTYNTWSVALLRAFLDHYGRPQLRSTSKRRLMQVMIGVVREHQLQDFDYDDMYLAYWNRQELPPRKPIASTLRPASLTNPTHQTQSTITSDSGLAAVPMEISSLKNPNSRERCVVCLDEFASEDMASRPIASNCSHKRNVCHTCVSQSIASQLDSKMWDQISCPACEAKMDYGNIQEFASAAIFARYDRLYFQAILSASGGQLRQCRHPGCDSVQGCFPDIDSYIVCQACSGHTCIACDVVFHTGLSCSEWRAQGSSRLKISSDELASEQLLAEKSKTCPQCGVRGIKTTGCDHVTCPRCEYEYCWLCFAKYEDILARGNDAHFRTCRHHAANTTPDYDESDSGEDDEIGHEYLGEDVDNEDLVADFAEMRQNRLVLDSATNP